MRVFIWETWQGYRKCRNWAWLESVDNFRENVVHIQETWCILSHRMQMKWFCSCVTAYHSICCSSLSYYVNSHHMEEY